MANPLVRKYMHFFGEDAGCELKEAWQANRWNHEADANVSGPMVRHDGKDYFVNEPALANWGREGEYRPVLPIRFFRRAGKDWAKIHHLRVHPTKYSLIIDAREGTCDELPLSAFWASYTEFKSDHSYLGWPDPSSIEGMLRVHLNYLYFNMSRQASAGQVTGCLTNC